MAMDEFSPVVPTTEKLGVDIAPGDAKRSARRGLKASLLFVVGLVRRAGGVIGRILWGDGDDLRERIDAIPGYRDARFEAERHRHQSLR
ncbi:hypothetical protein [Enemella sp. A6]|uniref:hypothetical protein n=1 Tax=Enemella sp. A6 TaxID=3440152 RepID=UPI003EB7DC5C